MIFDRIKTLFMTAAEIEKLPAPERDALAGINAEIMMARETQSAVEQSIASLNATIEAGTVAERDQLATLASPSGAAGLAEFSAGRDRGPVSRSVDKTLRAVQAADVARRFFPVAEENLKKARAKIVQLEAAKNKKMKEIKQEHGDRLARQYIDDVQRMFESHDQLVGFSRGSSSAGLGDTVVMSSETLEVPRFNLPSLRCKTDYSPFLTHVPS